MRAIRSYSSASIGCSSCGNRIGAGVPGPRLSATALLVITLARVTSEARYPVSL